MKKKFTYDIFVCVPKKSNTKEFIYKAKKIHGKTFIYSKVKYTLSKIPVIIVCKVHGKFKQTPDSHLKGYGCKKCYSDKLRSNTDEFIAKATLIHGDRYSYKLVKYRQRHKKIKIVCDKHTLPYIFEQTPRNHLQGNGCNRCVNRISKKETDWIDSLNIHGIIRQFKIPGTRLQVDAFDKKTNTVYEFHGDYWHGNPDIYKSSDINKHNGKTFGELYNETLLKEQEIKSLGYNLVVMWENDNEV